MLPKAAVRSYPVYNWGVEGRAGGVETFTGLRVDQFGRLLPSYRERGGEGCGWDRPWRLPLAVHYRTNLTMRQLVPLFGVSPATVCRVLQRLALLLALEPVRASQDTVERLWIVDGTLVPVRDRRVGASSRNCRFSANAQVIVDAETRLVVATARPVPDNTADARRRRLQQHRPDRPAPQTPRTTPAEGRGGQQRAASQDPRPRRTTAANAATASTTPSRPSSACTNSPSPHDRTGPKTASACEIRPPATPFKGRAHRHQKGGVAAWDHKSVRCY
ncbi:hypothetical protein RKD31_000823 [Streptomyces sp. SAI-163]